MAYNIKLFVHGNPDGQDIWGNPGSDAKYIEAFYGRKSNVSSQMLLEVMQFGGETNAYYTYYYKGKLQEKGGRDTGYFALTLRINYYYKDIQNIYNLLEAAFNKYIIGSVLEYTSGGGCRFKISQFNQANDILSDLENELVHYLMRFSSDQDFVSLSGFKSNGQNECGMINLLEAAPNVVYSHVKSTGKISVSSLYPSSKEQQIIDKMNAEIKAVNNNAQQQISAAQQNAQQQISTAQQKAQQDVLAAQKEKEQGIQAVKNEYKEADKTIKTLKAEKDNAYKDNERLNREVQKLNINLQRAQEKAQNYDNLQNELNNRNAVLDIIRKEISQLGSIPTINNTGSSKQKTEKDNSDYDWGPKPSPKPIVNKRLIGLGAIFAVIFIMLFFLFKSCGSKENSSDELRAAKDKIEALEKQLEEKKKTSFDDKDNVDDETFEMDDYDDDAKDDFLKKNPGARINVDPINESKGQYMTVSSEKSYTMSIEGVDKVPNGEYDCDPKDFDIDGDKIKPKRPGIRMIYYKVDGKVILDKPINVKE